MCEQGSVIYNDGDVVWVKLGFCWWPGEVVSFDKLPDDITESFKKLPQVVVKFFDEEKYEYVKQLANISSYNCDKKDDYIKKGLDMYRAKHRFMEKFGRDVVTAETKTDGDPNILSDPRFAPEKRPNYASIFGTPRSKKKDSPSRAKGRGSGRKMHSSPASAKKVSSLITHPRFLGKDDSEIRILVQTPSEVRIPEPEYQCYSCGFKASRVDVIVFHNKSHLRGGSVGFGSPKKTKKSPVKRAKKFRLPTTRTKTIMEDLELLRQGLPIFSDDNSNSSLTSDKEEESSGEEQSSSSSDDEPIVKRKAVSDSPVKPKKAKTIPTPEIKKQTDIRSDLLAEWDDDEEEEDVSAAAARLSPKPEESTKDILKTDEKEKSCFDFVEDEDDTVTKLEGRKIPRVIPPATDRRKSTQEPNLKSRSPTPNNIEENIIIESENDKLKEKKDTTSPKKSDSRESQFQKEFEAFNNALKEATVPEVLDIPPLHKYEQNFYNAKTIKFPDKIQEESIVSKESPPPASSKSESSNKSEEVKSPKINKVELSAEPEPVEAVKEPIVKSTEVATKLTNPKKRFAKTFEDETKNLSKEEPAKEEKKEVASPKPVKEEFKSLEVAKLKTQLMKKLVDGSPTKENITTSTPIVRKEPKRRAKIIATVGRVELAGTKDNKRTIAEPTSGNESQTHVKRKKYSSDHKDSSNTSKDVAVETLETAPIQEQSVKKHPSKKEPVKDIKSSKFKSIDHMEYLNTSPTKIFSDLRVDKDDIPDATTLSEAQRLTIQNIIGVTSPLAPTRQLPKLEEKSKNKPTIKITQNKDKLLHTKESKNNDEPTLVGGSQSKDEQLLVGGSQSKDESLLVGGIQNKDEPLLVGGNQSKDEPLVVGGSQSKDELMCKEESRSKDELMYKEESRSKDELKCKEENQSKVEHTCIEESQNQEESMHLQESQSKDEHTCIEESQKQEESMHLQESQSKDEPLHVGGSQSKDELLPVGGSQGKEELMCKEESQNQEDSMHLQESQSKDELRCKEENQSKDEHTCIEESQNQEESMHLQESQSKDEQMCREESENQDEPMHLQESQSKSEQICIEENQNKDERVGIEGDQNKNESILVHESESKDKLMHIEDSQSKDAPIHVKISEAVTHLNNTQGPSTDEKIEEVSTPTAELTEKIETISETTEESIKDTDETNIEDMKEEIFSISSKLDPVIPEKLPDEIIETKEEIKETNQKIDCVELKNEPVVVETEKLTEELKVSEEKFEEAVQELAKELVMEEEVIIEEVHKDDTDKYLKVSTEVNAEETIEKKLEVADEKMEEKTNVPTPETAQCDKTDTTIVETQDKTCDVEKPIDINNTIAESLTVVVKPDKDITDESPTDVKESEVIMNVEQSFELTSKKTSEDLVKSMFQEDEIVNIEGNLTVVTESDLADKQVEITATPEVSKPVTLSSFSMDFCEDVETYIKADTIIPAPSKSKSTPIAVTKEEITKTTIIPEKDVHEEVRTEEKNDKNTPKENLAESVRILEKESSKTKKFEDIIAPAKEVPPSVIMEGFEDVPEDRLTIDESNIKPHAIVEEKAIQKAVVKVSATGKVSIGENIFYTEPPPLEKEEIIVPPMDISVESEVAKITDSIAEQEVMVQDSHQNTSSTKLLEILTDKPKSHGTKASVVASAQFAEASRGSHKHSKVMPRQSTHGSSKTSKPTILSSRLIKPIDESKLVSVKKVTSKRSYQDVEDIDTYIIQKPLKKLNVSMESDISPPKVLKKTPIISKGKARILQQTIITPTGDILQPPMGQHQSDDNMFDINSMPIVLSDELLTADGMENMQIVLQENTPAASPKTQINPIKRTPAKLLNKTPSPAGATMKEITPKPPVQKTTPTPTLTLNKQKMQKVYPSVTTTAPKLLRHSPSVITQPGKQGNFIIVPATTTATGTKYTVGKRPAIVKKPPPPKALPPVTKVSEATTIGTTGNKIMILKSQGQQQKIMLKTPQKQSPSPKITKGRTVAPKQIIAKELSHQKGPNIISQTIVNSKGQITTLANQSPRQQIIASVPQQNRNIKIDPVRMKRIQQQQQLPKELSKPGTSGQRTIIIKNPQGQTVKKFQGTDDALLEQQVAEQLQAISRASANQQMKEIATRPSIKLPAKKTFGKKQEHVKQQPVSKTMVQSAPKNVSIPPLAPISPSKKGDYSEQPAEEPKRVPHQLVIQDAQGNQTTITEGQILALPSEAIDGQPHSYVLVTLDETGNLTPLNSEALMSLDPNLNLSSDLGNMVLQIDQGATTETETKTAETQQRPVVSEKVQVRANPESPPKESTESKLPSVDDVLTETPPTEAAEQNVQAVINSGEMGQLIITGDAATAQKFLESLAEGNADLANLLANAEGNVLIQADGQQILINTDAENPMLVMNPEGAEGSGANPIFANQPVKNQDILAAALADTDVFQQEQSLSKVAQSQLSPNSALYPMNVTNVLETNSMSSPIMTPLEVPSTNSKKIDDESEILNQVPKNVDLPITVTDPNISQTVAQQQAALMAPELPSNLDLPLAIQDPVLSVTSAEMSSPSFVYSLPTLDDSVDINQKTFSGSISMPLLTEEPEDSPNTAGASINKSDGKEDISSDDKKDTEEKNDKNAPGDKDLNLNDKDLDPDDKDLDSDDKKTDFLDDSDGLCGIRRGICNSLSEPPPDMFDFSVGNQSYDPSNDGDMDIRMDSTPSSDGNPLNDRESSVSSLEERKNEGPASLFPPATSPSTNTDDSCEIPIQPPLIAKPFAEENGTSSGNDKTVTVGDV